MVTAEPTLSPAELGLDAKRLSYLDAHLQRYVDEGRLAGTLVLVARQGEIGHFAAAGLADIARKTPMKRDTIFRIYSMTRAVNRPVTIRDLLTYTSGLSYAPQYPATVGGRPSRGSDA